MSCLRAKVLEQLKNDLGVAQALYKAKDSIVKDIEFDGDSTVSFKLHFPGQDPLELSLVIPDNYPKEDITMITPGADMALSSDLKIYPGCELKDLFPKIINDKKIIKPRKKNL